MLYVHPGAVGQGVASMLCDALEKLAGAPWRQKPHGRRQRQCAQSSSRSAAMSPSSATP